ncbi:MAG TPA: TGS domain-containing protein [Acidimicrobiia bacterium]
MPANLTPEYKAAEAAYRRARDSQERLELLREMLRTIPKHKGTEHLRADIKTRIKELTSELSTRRTGARGGPHTVVRPEGAAQIALLGAPNSGKSTLHARLTGSHAQAGPYPFTTQHPLPGMMPFKDTAFQLVDLPPLSSQHPIPWIANALHPADGCLLLIDLTDPDAVSAAVTIRETLVTRRVVLSPSWPDRRPGLSEGEADLFTKTLPTVLAYAKIDLLADPEDDVRTFVELTGLDHPSLRLSGATGEGLDSLGRWLFDQLGVVRVYTKVPGEAADRGRPYTLRHGQTVSDLAYQVHKDIGQALKYARIWGSESFEGQQVGREHLLNDGDVIELHV